MLITKRGDLRQMGDAQYLMRFADAPQFFADNLAGAPAHADINFIEHQRWHSIHAGQNGFHRQQQPRRFATRRDPRQRFEWFARVWAEKKLNRVYARAIKRHRLRVVAQAHATRVGTLRQLDIKLNVRHRQIAHRRLNSPCHFITSDTAFGAQFTSGQANFIQQQPFLRG